jgi:hypothetical protein
LKFDLDEVVLCVDQSGSMASSVIYASIFAAVMASLPVVRTELVCFDTAIIAPGGGNGRDGPGSSRGAGFQPNFGSRLPDL